MKRIDYKIVLIPMMGVIGFLSGAIYEQNKQKIPHSKPVIIHIQVKTDVPDSIIPIISLDKQ